MIPYGKDIYGNFVLKSQDLTIDIIQNKLPAFLSEVQKTSLGRAVKLDVDYGQAEIIPLLKKLGFDFFYSDNHYAQWVYRNGSPMPKRAVVSSLRACVALIKDNHVLFTEQRNNTELAGKILLPGGNVDPNELPYDGGVREVKEETGLDVQSMQLVAILSRIKEGILGVTSTDFWYVCQDFIGKTVKQAAEIEQLVWVPLEVCAFEQVYKGLQIAHYNILMQHILGQAKKTIYSCEELSLKMPGYLQLIPFDI